MGLLYNPDVPPTLAWKVPIESIAMDTSIWYGDGKIYAGETSGFMTAWDAKTGALAWRTPVKGAAGYCGCYYMGLVIHGSLDNNLYAIDADTGEIVWTYNPGTFWEFGQPAQPLLTE